MNAKHINQINPKYMKEIQEYAKKFDKTYIKTLKKMKTYSYYMMRTLNRVGINIRPSDIVFLTFENKTNTISHAIVYPMESVKDKKVVNPLFFYAVKFEYDFKNLDNPFKAVFTEKVEEWI